MSLSDTAVFLVIRTSVDKLEPRIFAISLIKPVIHDGCLIVDLGMFREITVLTPLEPSQVEVVGEDKLKKN